MPGNEKHGAQTASCNDELLPRPVPLCEDLGSCITAGMLAPLPAYALLNAYAFYDAAGLCTPLYVGVKYVTTHKECHSCQHAF